MRKPAGEYDWICVLLVCVCVFICHLTPTAYGEYQIAKWISNFDAMAWILNTKQKSK